MPEDRPGQFRVDMIRPGTIPAWHHEKAGPAFFNAWTLTHVAWGFIAERAVSFGIAMAAHFAYEMVEGEIFPAEDRDISMANHVGDTVGFIAGFYLAKKF
jgi:hypothetical protein